MSRSRFLLCVVLAILLSSYALAQGEWFQTGELATVIGDIRRRSGHQDSPAAIDGMVEVLACLFEGLLQRTIRNPGLDRDKVTQRIQIAIDDLLNQPGEDALAARP